MDRTRAQTGVDYLQQMSVDMRGCAILDADGETLAASGELGDWAAPARELFEAADAAGAETAEHVHVATEDGEVFAVRQDGLAAVAVTERFTLASLVVFDMRSVLRDAAGKSGV